MQHAFPLGQAGRRYDVGDERAGPVQQHAGGLTVGVDLVRPVVGHQRRIVEEAEAPDDVERVGAEVPRVRLPVERSGRCDRTERRSAVLLRGRSPHALRHLPQPHAQRVFSRHVKVPVSRGKPAG